jgi:microcystin-dependent protein
VLWGGAAVNTPAGWLPCQGQSLIRAAYSALFSVIGTTYGASDGATFNLPNTLGITVRGADNTIPLGSTGGSDTVTLNANNLPAHTHSITDPGHSHNVTLTDLYNNGGGGSAITYVGQLPGGSGGNRTQTGGAVTTTTGITATNVNTTTGTAVNVTNEYIALNYMIKVA